MRRIFILVILLTVSSQAFTKSLNYTPYVIKKGDVISKVVLDNSLVPLYGEKEWVAKVLKLNRLTEQTAKKLEPGDVVVIPVSSKFFTEKEYQDEVSVMKSSWVREIEAQYLAPKENNLSVSGSYFTRNYDFKDETVSVNQNFMATVEYKKRKVDLDKSFSLNPIYSASIYTQSNADFETNDQLVAEFTPSTLISAAVELEDRDTGIAMTAQVEHEYFSTIDYDGANYKVTKESLVWVGAGFHKNIRVDQNSYIASFTLDKGSNFDALKYGAKIGSFIKQHYKFDIFATNTNLNITKEVSIFSTGITLGYRF